MPWIYFRVGETEYDPSFQEYEDPLGAAVRGYRDGRLNRLLLRGSRSVACPADDQEPDVEIRRAQAVADALVARGVPRDRIELGAIHSQPYPTHVECAADSEVRDSSRVVVMAADTCTDSERSGASSPSM